MPNAPRAPRRVIFFKYEPRYCVEVVEFMGRGYSLTAFAGEIGASRADLERWREDHPPFAAAVERAQARRARLLEDRMLASKDAKALSAQLDALKAAAPEEWSGAEAPPPQRGKSPRPAVDLPDNGRA